MFNVSFKFEVCVPKDGILSIYKVEVYYTGHLLVLRSVYARPKHHPEFNAPFEENLPHGDSGFT